MAQPALDAGRYLQQVFLQCSACAFGTRGILRLRGHNLGELRPGDLIYVTRQDRQTAVFRVYSAALYLKADFPTRTVYGYTSWPTLRLITCGGEFDQATGHYLGNTVDFAEYIGQSAAAKGP